MPALEMLRWGWWTEYQWQQRSEASSLGLAHVVHDQRQAPRTGGLSGYGAFAPFHRSSSVVDSRFLYVRCRVER
jgi:hypothetical protein